MAVLVLDPDTLVLVESLDDLENVKSGRTARESVGWKSSPTDAGDANVTPTCPFSWAFATPGTVRTIRRTSDIAYLPMTDPPCEYR